MRILIAADSFKDALPAPEVCRAIAQGLRRAAPHASLREFPLADGGEGTVEVLAGHLKLRTVSIECVDPLGRPLQGAYGLSEDGATAVIEMARASGLQLLAHDERDPLRTGTRGTGLLVADALRRGVRRLVLAIGGSATTDGGIGLAQALGWRFEDAAGQPLEPVGGALIHLARIVPPVPMHPDCSVEVICDVDNPLYGPSGAAQVYGPQKGADAQAVILLDQGLRRLAARVQDLMPDPGLALRPGAGAAGGLGFGALAFLGGRLRRGIELVMDLSGFDAALGAADLVVTGEGAIDAQTLHGKLIHGICQRAAARGVPVLALCGRLAADPAQLRAIGLREAHCINPQPRPLAEMLSRTAENLTRTAASLTL